jgi:hypothetical protein
MHLPLEVIPIDKSWLFRHFYSKGAALKKMCVPLWSVAFPFKKSHLSTGTMIRSDEVAFTRFRQCNIFLEEATCCNISLQQWGILETNAVFRENGWKWYNFQTCWIMKMHFSIEELNQIDKTRAWTTIHRMQYSSTKFAFLFNRCFFKRCTYSFQYVVLVWKKLFLKANTSFQVCILTFLLSKKRIRVLTFPSTIFVEGSNM